MLKVYRCSGSAQRTQCSSRQNTDTEKTHPLSGLTINVTLRLVGVQTLNGPMTTSHGYQQVGSQVPYIGREYGYYREFSESRVAWIR